MPEEAAGCPDVPHRASTAVNLILLIGSAVERPCCPVTACKGHADKVNSDTLQVVLGGHWLHTYALFMAWDLHSAQG